MHKSNGTKSGQVLIPSSNKISSIVLSPADPKLIYLIGNKGKNWLSEDCGANLKPLNDDKKLQDIKFHPTQREWAISSIYKSCDDFSDEEWYGHQEIYATTNLGKTWKKLEENIMQYEWGKQSADDNVPNEQIIVVKAKGKKEIQSDSWSVNNDIIVSDDFFKTKRTLLKGGNYFKITKDYLYAGKVTSQETKILTRALKKYQYQNFFDMEISKKNLHQFDFSVIESATGAVFLFVARPGKQLKSGNIYLSDATGTGFTLNLEKVPYSNSFEFDFEEIESLEGVIIANTFDPDNIENTIEDKPGKSKSNKFNRNADPETKRKTYISFNRGGKWQSLTPPIKSSKGKLIGWRIENGCSLHLHSLTSDRYPFPYSIQNGVGIIVGVGNTGQFLQYDDNKLNTYISRDGGVTWFEIIKGPHIVEFGDHGGLILLAPLYNKTDYILYSWNYGIDWEALQLPTKMQVDNIVIEPKSMSSNFIAFGESADGGKGIVVTLNFEEVHQRNCNGLSNPDSKDSDYEYWSPNDGRHGTAWFLGRKVSYVRRKMDSAWYNGMNYEQQQFVDNCEWTRLDFEWDNGYKKEPNSDTCVLVANQTEMTIPEEWTDFYTVTTGYRKIPGDSWVGGEDYTPIRVVCPKPWGLFSLRTLLILCITLLLGYFSAKYINENGFPTKEEIIGLFKKTKKKKNKDDEFNYDIGYNDSDSDENSNKNSQPTLELEQENDYNDFMEGISLRNKQE